MASLLKQLGVVSTDKQLNFQWSIRTRETAAAVAAVAAVAAASTPNGKHTDRRNDESRNRERGKSCGLNTPTLFAKGGPLYSARHDTVVQRRYIIGNPSAYRAESMSYMTVTRNPSSESLCRAGGTCAGSIPDGIMIIGANVILLILLHESLTYNGG